MHLPKKRVLLLLALAVVAVLSLLPATASALSGPGVEVVGQPWPAGGYISSTAVDVRFMSSAPTGVFWSLNSINTTAGDAYLVADESASTAYAPGTYVAKEGYALEGTAPVDGDVVEIRVSFWKEAAQTNLVASYIVQVTYNTSIPVATADVYPSSSGNGPILGQFGVDWFNTPYLSADFDLGAAVPLGSIFWNVDGDTGSASNPTLPVTEDIYSALTGGVGSHEKDGLHNAKFWARSAANVTGPQGTYDFGVDTKAPLITVEGLDAAWHSGNVTITVTYSDPGGSGVSYNDGVTSYFPEVDILDDMNVTVAGGWDNSGYGANMVSYKDYRDPLNPYKTIAELTFSIPNTADGANDWYVLAGAYDMVGNWRSTTVDFGVDMLPPSTKYTADQPKAVTDAAPGGTWTNKPVTLTFSAIDAGLSGVDFTEYVVSAKASDVAPALSASGTKGTSVTIDQTADKGIVRVWYRSVDKAGNKEAWNLAWVWFDGVKPVVAVQDNYLETITAWMNDDFDVKVLATDANSDLAAPGIQYMVPNWAEWFNGNPTYVYADWSPGSQSPAYVDFNVTAVQSDGIYTLMVKVSDVAGNAATADYTVKVDTRDPKSDGAEGWIKGGAPYTITGTDQASGSGIAVTWYRVDQATKWTANPNLGPADPMTQAPVTLETPVTIAGANGSVHTVDFFSIDNSVWQWWDADDDEPFPGNAEGQTLSWTAQEYPVPVGYVSRTVKIDSAAPTTTVAGNDSDWHKTAVTLFFTATDAESGVDFTEWSLDGTNWTKGNQAVVAKNGVVTVSYRSVDKVGNVEATQTVEVKVATTAPKVTAYNATAKVGKTATIKYKVMAVTAKADVKIVIRNSKGLAVRAYFLSDRGTNAVKTFKAKTGLKAGTYKITITAVDEAGNVQSKAGVAKLVIKK